MAEMQNSLGMQGFVFGKNHAKDNTWQWFEAHKHAERQGTYGMPRETKGSTLQEQWRIRTRSSSCQDSDEPRSKRWNREGAVRGKGSQESWSHLLATHRTHVRRFALKRLGEERPVLTFFMLSAEVTSQVSQQDIPGLFCRERKSTQMRTYM